MTLTYFNIGNYKLAFGTCECTTDKLGRLMRHAAKEQAVWIWNGYFWCLFVRECKSFDDGQQRAAELLSQNH